MISCNIAYISHFLPKQWRKIYSYKSESWHHYLIYFMACVGLSASPGQDFLFLEGSLQFDLDKCLQDIPCCAPWISVIQGPISHILLSCLTVILSSPFPHCVLLPSWKPLLHGATPTLSGDRASFSEFPQIFVCSCVALVFAGILTWLGYILPPGLDVFPALMSKLVRREIQ